MNGKIDRRAAQQLREVPNEDAGSAETAEGDIGDLIPERARRLYRERLIGTDRLKGRDDALCLSQCENAAARADDEGANWRPPE